MQLTEEEQRYLECLASGKTFEQMAIELGMTVEEIDDFGTQFFDRAFAEKRRGIN